MHFGRAVPVLFRRFPSLEALSLKGEKMTMCKELKGELNFVIIGFSKKHTVEMDRWWNFAKGAHFKLREMHNQKNAMQFYRIYIHHPFLRPFRSILENQHKNNIWDTTQDERTFTTFTDKYKFCDRLGLPDPRRAYAMIVNRDGEIKWVDHEHGTIEKFKQVSWRLGISEEELHLLTDDKELEVLEAHYEKIDDMMLPEGHQDTKLLDDQNDSKVVSTMASSIEGKDSDIVQESILSASESLKNKPEPNLYEDENKNENKKTKSS